SLSVSVGDSKREHLPSKVCKRVPVGTPVARHWNPVVGIGGLDIHGLDRAGSSDIGDKHKVEVVMTRMQTESRADKLLILSSLLPFVHDGDDASTVDTDLLPSRLCHVEVRPWRVAPAALVAGQLIVGWAEVGGGDHDRDAWFAKHGVRPLAVACDLVALPTGNPVIEERCAQRRRSRTIPLRIQIAVPARAACHHRRTSQN
ncbi:hypothetical protein U9M48_024998, partial [Paspalum notatum var. saurae]